MADKNLRYQQRLSTRAIAIIELPTNRPSAMPLLAPDLQAAIDAATSGSYVTLILGEDVRIHENRHVPILRRAGPSSIRRSCHVPPSFRLNGPRDVPPW